MSIGLPSPKTSEGALNQGNSSTISMATSRTTGCPICSSLVGANIAENHSLSWNNSEKKCIVCGKNCGKPALLDLFSGAGGAARGYQRAGFCVLGVDIKPQPHYAGCRFVQADALTYPLEGFDAYHASPPCQAYTRMAQGLLESQGRGRDYPKLIDPTRDRLKATQKPYVIENVPGSPLIEPIRLCGSSFGLKVQRHRLFESNIAMLVPPCAHCWQGKEDLPPLHRLVGHSRVVGCYGNGRGKGDNKQLWSEAMGITWMTRKELSQAIPPDYTEYIGLQLRKVLGYNNIDESK